MEVVLKKKSFVNNVVIALIAQAISLLCSIAVSLVLPKFFTVVDFAYWQLFSFYIGYVGVFHFGFNDGIYLKLGGKEYEELNFGLIKSEMCVLGFVELFISILITIFACASNVEDERKVVIIAVGIYLVINNLCGCYGYIFQAVNFTRSYSLSIIIEKIVFVVLSVGLFFFHSMEVKNLIYGYISAKIIALIYCMIRGKKITTGRLTALNFALKYFINAMKSGIFLMLANLSSTLILGIGRYVMDMHWGIEAFGKFSFANSLTQFSLLFISQFSMVMFPELRRKTKENNIIIYKEIKNKITWCTPFVYLLYVPCQLLVYWWLPQYSESMRYLIILLPICLFDGKMNILFNTYLKVYKKEKRMFGINIIAVFISTLITMVGAFIFNNQSIVIYGMVIAVIIRSIIAEFTVNRLMDESIKCEWQMDLFFTLVFWLIFQSIDYVISAAIIYILVVIVIITMKHLIKNIRYFC